MSNHVAYGAWDKFNWGFFACNFKIKFIFFWFEGRPKEEGHLFFNTYLPSQDNYLVRINYFSCQVLNWDHLIHKPTCKRDHLF